MTLAHLADPFLGDVPSLDAGLFPPRSNADNGAGGARNQGDVWHLGGNRTDSDVPERINAINRGEHSDFPGDVLR